MYYFTAPSHSVCFHYYNVQNRRNPHSAFLDQARRSDLALASLPAETLLFTMMAMAGYD
jgi:hypothetical protein